MSHQKSFSQRKFSCVSRRFCLVQDGGVDEILRRQLDGLRVEATARAKSEAVLREEIRRLKRRYNQDLWCQEPR